MFTVEDNFFIIKVVYDFNQIAAVIYLFIFVVSYAI